MWYKAQTNMISTWTSAFGLTDCYPGCVEQSGAVGARLWATNPPEVRRSKLRSAKVFCLFNDLGTLF